MTLRTREGWSTGVDARNPRKHDSSPVVGGRTWWAHLVFTRINTELSIPKNQIEELMTIKGIGEKSFLKLKPLVTVAAERTERAADK